METKQRLSVRRRAAAARYGARSNVAEGAPMHVTRCSHPALIAAG